MHGLEAIAQCNGWNIAMTGIIIVFSGLAILSFAISQLHKILGLWEGKDTYIQHVKEQLKVREQQRLVERRRTKDRRQLKEEKLENDRRQRRDRRNRTEGQEFGIMDLELQRKVLEAANQFSLLVQRLGEPFSLPKLLNLAVQRGLERPHSNLSNLLKLNLIIPDKLGFYRWDQKVYDVLLEQINKQGLSDG